jgi:hypothetical protein
MSFFFNLFNPTPKKLAARHLKDAELNLLLASQQVEYYVAVERMYRERIVRLRGDIALIDDEAKQKVIANALGSNSTDLAVINRNGHAYGNGNANSNGNGMQPMVSFSYPIPAGQFANVSFNTITQAR